MAETLNPMKNLKFSSLFIILTFLISASLIAQQPAVVSGVSLERLGKYEAFLEKETDEGRIPGAISLIMRKGEIVHDYEHGLSSIKGKKKMEADNIFYIQSMTKPIITVAFMTLYEEGHFFLDDPVSKYLPQFKDLKVAKNPEDGVNGETVPVNIEVTIAHLLSHTAGFSHGLGGTQLEKDLARVMYYESHENIDSRVDALASMPLYGQPGEQWYYSASPDVLALLIEKFSGKSPDVFLQEKIFDPLGMKDTGYNLTKKQQKRCVQVHYINEEGNLVNVPRQTAMEGNKVFGGTHGLFSTASDYMKFCQMMLNQGELNGVRILSPKTVEIMRINQIGDLAVSPGNGFGFGFGILSDLADNKATGSVGQYYWSGAYCTYFFIDPEEELIAILMMQMAPYSNYYPKKMRQFIYAAMVD